jgi:hypothetical protein
MSEVALYLCGKGLSPSSASLGFTVSSQVDMLGARYKSIQVGKEPRLTKFKWTETEQVPLN